MQLSIRHNSPNMYVIVCTCITYIRLGLIGQGSLFSPPIAHTMRISFHCMSSTDKNAVCIRITHAINVFFLKIILYFAWEPACWACSFPFPTTEGFLKCSVHASLQDFDPCPRMPKVLLTILWTFKTFEQTRSTWSRCRCHNHWYSPKSLIRGPSRRQGMHNLWYSPSPKSLTREQSWRQGRHKVVTSAKVTSLRIISS